MTPTRPDTCEFLCEVDPSALIAWLDDAGGWLVQPSEAKPQRIHHGIPDDVLAPTLDRVLAEFPPGHVADSAMLSRMQPGQSHPMHTDLQRANWVTRIHVPLTTNEGCWHEFEDDDLNRICKRVTMAVGDACTFNALARHSFANHGDTDRVHLIFDVLDES